jgi:hypothetical protein
VEEWLWRRCSRVSPARSSKLWARSRPITAQTSAGATARTRNGQFSLLLDSIQVSRSLLRPYTLHSLLCGHGVRETRPAAVQSTLIVVHVTRHPGHHTLSPIFGAWMPAGVPLALSSWLPAAEMRSSSQEYVLYPHTCLIDLPIVCSLPHPSTLLGRPSLLSGPVSPPPSLTLCSHTAPPPSSPNCLHLKPRLSHHHVHANPPPVP